MSKGGRRRDLARSLDSHIRSIEETFEILYAAAPPTLDKVDWSSQVAKHGDEVSKQATIGNQLFLLMLPCIFLGLRVGFGSLGTIKQKIDACNGFYCYGFKPNNYIKPVLWTEDWNGWLKENGITRTTTLPFYELCFMKIVAGAAASPAVLIVSKDC